MSIGLFLGCTVPVRAMNYEQSFRRVCQELKIDIVDVPDFTCCGFPLKSMNYEAGLLLALRNLAIAEKGGITSLVALCNACAENLSEANRIWQEDSEFKVNLKNKLNQLGYEYKGIEVRHAARFLYEGYRSAFAPEKIKNKLSSLKLYPYSGCHFSRPSSLYGGFDSPENPSRLAELLQMTGAQVISLRNDCCGGAVLGINEGISLKMANLTLTRAKESGADAMVLICPFCNVMFEQNQKKIEKTFAVSYDLPVLYLPQVLGYALGIPKEELGFNLNRIKMDNFWVKLEAQ